MSSQTEETKALELAQTELRQGIESAQRLVREAKSLLRGGGKAARAD